MSGPYAKTIWPVTTEDVQWSSVSERIKEIAVFSNEPALAKELDNLLYEFTATAGVRGSIAAVVSKLVAAARDYGITIEREKLD